MIINEKYLQDIDDEDEEVEVSDGILNNHNRYEFEVTLEYDKDVPIWGYTDSGECPDELPGFSTDDFLYYKYRLENILDSLYIVQDYSIRIWTQGSIQFDTDDMSNYNTKVFDEKYIEIPTVMIRFNTYASPTYKRFYEVIQKLCISYTKFIDVFDYYKDDSSHRDYYLSVTVNGFLINGFRNVAYKLKSHFDSIMGIKEEMEIPDRKVFRYNGSNSNHISELSEKGIDEFKFGDVLYSTYSGDLVSQDKNSDGTKNSPIAICFRSAKGDHRFVSLNMMSRHNPSVGQRKFSYDAEIPWGAKGVMVGCTNALYVQTQQMLELITESELVTGEKDTHKGLAYMTNCYRNKTNRSCDKDVYFSNDLPFENTKGLLQSFLCVNRFHTKGTKPGDWYFPSVSEVSMFTNLLIKKESLDGRFDDLGWKEYKTKGVLTGIFNLPAGEIINHVRKSLHYEPMSRLIISSTEVDKNNIKGCYAKYAGIDSKVYKTDESTVFACLRITD